MTRVNNDRSHTLHVPVTETFINKRNEPSMSLLASHTASSQFSLYSFLIPLRTGSCVDLSGGLHTEMVAVVGKQ